MPDAKRGPKRKPITERFWSRVVKTESCWLYGGIDYGNHYAQLTQGGRSGKNVLAHRLSFEMHHGPVPRGKFVCHRCDVRNCVNPGHLYAGDHEDNNRDRIDRGRSAGAGRKLTVRARAKAQQQNRHGRALSVELRSDLVREYAAGKFTQKQLAKRYRVSQGTVSATVRGKRNMGAAVPVKKRSGFYRRKFPVSMAFEVRDLYASGQFTQQQIADRFGCSQDYVSLIVRQKRP